MVNRNVVWMTMVEVFLDGEGFGYLCSLYYVFCPLCVGFASSVSNVCEIERVGASLLWVLDRSSGEEVSNTFHACLLFFTDLRPPATFFAFSWGPMYCRSASKHQKRMDSISVLRTRGLMLCAAEQEL